MSNASIVLYFLAGLTIPVIINFIAFQTKYLGKSQFLFAERRPHESARLGMVIRVVVGLLLIYSVETDVISAPAATLMSLLFGVEGVIFINYRYQSLRRYVRGLVNGNRFDKLNEQKIMKALADNLTLTIECKHDNSGKATIYIEDQLKFDVSLYW